MKPVHIVAGLLAIGVPAAAWAWSNSQKAAPPRPPPGNTPLPGGYPVNATTKPTAATQAPAGGTLAGASSLLVKTAAGALGVAPGAVVGAAVALDFFGQAVGGATGSAGQGALSSLYPAFGVGAVAAKGIQDVTGSKLLGQTLGSALVLGPGALPVAEGVSAGIGAIAGAQAEKDVRAAASSLDPTKRGTVTNAVVTAAASVVSDAAGAVGSLFHSLF